MAAPDSQEDEELDFPAADEFWSLVALARSDFDAYHARLAELETPRVAGLAHVFYALESELDTLARALIPSEDLADDFCGWIVAQGPEVFARAVRDPDWVGAVLLESFSNSTSADSPGSDIRYAASELYEERTSQLLEEYVDCAFFIEDHPEFCALLSEE